MAQFVKVTQDIVIDLDKVSYVSHDASGFYSLTGDTKSISIHLDNGESVQIMEDDAQYQTWLNFLNNQETFEQHNARVERTDLSECEIASMLFSLLSNLPNADKVAMTLYPNGEGRIEEVPVVKEVLAWGSLAEGLVKLQDYFGYVRRSGEQACEQPIVSNHSEWTAEDVAIAHNAWLASEGENK